MFILASNSPRRKQLLSSVVKDFKIVPSNFDESLVMEKTPLKTTKEIAFNKGKDVHQANPNDVVISADTIVVIDNKIIGKPKDADDAVHILNTLSNRTHIVYTAYCIFYKTKIIRGYSRTLVTFNKLSKDLIKDYVASKSPLDKAGAYGVQDNEEYHIIKNVKGNLNNVIGFPIEKIKKDLIKLGINI